MFQFPGFAFNPYVFRIKYPHSDNRKSEPGNSGVETQALPDSKFQLSKVGFPIRKSTGQSLFAAHRSLSQRTTSFIASCRQGIHEMPLGHLIALISNAHLNTARFRGLESPSTRRIVLGRVALLIKPVFIEINPNRSAVKQLRALASGAGYRLPEPQAYPFFTMSRTRRFWSAEPMSSFAWTAQQRRIMVEPDGIEPTTSCLQSTRSPS